MSDMTRSVRGRVWNPERTLNERGTSYVTHPPRVVVLRKPLPITLANSVWERVGDGPHTILADFWLVVERGA